ncbi:low molecular weight phosphotyrosine protein phosphatase-like isoform X3 [Ostrea edulis]|nr:low molecular weight phosphotyrosine protein phosphatase-like isoform X3 [Ostrea edulis]
MSEGIFHHLVKSKGLQDQWNIDSAGIANWHEGKPPDEFTVAMLQRNNMMDGYHHRARQITEADFTKFKFILGMDDYNLRKSGVCTLLDVFDGGAVSWARTLVASKLSW